MRARVAMRGGAAMTGPARNKGRSDGSSDREKGAWVR